MVMFQTLMLQSPSKKGSKGESYGDILDLSFLNGKTIIDSGYMDNATNNMTYDGFAIDYLDDSKKYRVVLGFNESGIWIKWNGELDKDNSEDILKDRLHKVYNDFCDNEIVIIDKPLQRGYSFTDEDGREIIFISCTDLKIMGEDICNHFVSKEAKNVDEIIYAIAQWLF